MGFSFRPIRLILFLCIIISFGSSCVENTSTDTGRGRLSDDDNDDDLPPPDDDIADDASDDSSDDSADPDDAFDDSADDDTAVPTTTTTTSTTLATSTTTTTTSTTAATSTTTTTTTSTTVQASTTTTTTTSTTLVTSTTTGTTSSTTTTTISGDGCTTFIDGPFNIIEEENLGYVWECIDEVTGDTSACACVEGYYNFLDSAAEYSHPITEEELDRQIEDIAEGLVPLIDPEDNPLNYCQVNNVLTDLSNIRFLKEGLNERELTVTTVRTEDKGDYIEKELIFSDPYILTWRALMLSPKDAGTYPAVIAFHGHTTNPEIYRDDYGGSEYPSNGYIILMPTIRALCVDEYEDQTTRDFLLEGFTRAGVEAYEVMLSLKYLYYLGSLEDPVVDKFNIGLIGHSGGSSLISFTSRLLPQGSIKSAVGDLANLWLYDFLPQEECEDCFGHMMAPPLQPYTLYVYDITYNSPIPFLVVPYDYIDPDTGDSSLPQIFDFWDDTLKSPK